VVHASSRSVTHGPVLGGKAGHGKKWILHANTLAGSRMVGYGIYAEDVYFLLNVQMVELLAQQDRLDLLKVLAVRGLPAVQDKPDLHVKLEVRHGQI